MPLPRAATLTETVGASLREKMIALVDPTAAEAEALRADKVAPRPAAEKIVYVSPQGLDTNSGLAPDRAVKTLAQAKTVMGTTARGIIEMSIGTIDAGAGTSFSGYRCALKGMGTGTVVKPSVAQVGPVIDLAGWLHPGFEYVQEFSDFTIEGDNTAGITKLGMSIPNCTGLSVRNVTTRYTGGPGFDFSGTQLSDFQNLVVSTPVSANANDVPYYRATGPTNGNTFRNLGVRSTITTADTGVSGAFVFTADATYAPGENYLEIWYEFLHLPTNGCVLSMAGYSNEIRLRPFDSSKVSGATGTCHVRLLAPAVEDIGGNVVWGYIPGNGGGAAELDYGVELVQSRNRVEGTKGYNGKNVLLKSGCNYSFVELKGQSSGAGGMQAGWTNSSGNETHQLIDHERRHLQWNSLFMKESSQYTWEMSLNLFITGLMGIGITANGGWQCYVASTSDRTGLGIQRATSTQTASILQCLAENTVPLWEVDSVGRPKWSRAANQTTTARTGASKWFEIKDSAGTSYWVEGKLP